MSQNQQHAEALAALDEVEQHVNRSASGKAALAGNVCDEYRRLRPSLEKIVTFVRLIPVYGPKIAAALQFLMGLADSLCGASS